MKSVFLQTQATHFETGMTTVDEVSDKTKVADEFILRSVLLDCFTADSMSKLIHDDIDVSLHVKLLIKVIRLHIYVCANEHLSHFFYVLVCYSLLFSSEIIPKQLFISGSVNIVE